MTTGSSNRIKSPCIGVCTSALGDRVCLGCKRLDYEVVEWNRYTEDQKRSVLERIEREG